MASNNTVLKVGLTIGLVFLLIVLACGGLVFYLTMHFGGMVTDAIDQHDRREVFAKSWRPPATDTPADELFPVEADGLTLEGHDELAQLAQFDIDAAGLHGTYRSDDRTVDVYIYRINNLEGMELAKRVIAATKKIEHNKRVIWGGPSNDRVYITISPPDQRGVLWRHSGWQFFFHSADDQDLDPFLEDFLRQMGE
jgi:hypothetical protein